MAAGGLLEGKVALVTGGGRGVGRDIALQMAAQGAAVLVNDLGGSETGEGASESPAMEVVREIGAAGGRASANADSVAGFAAAQGMVDQAYEELGGLDIVVNNAGILRDAIFHKMTEDDWDSVISVHLKGSFNIARAAATVFRGQESGAMIHMTSTSGLVGNFGQANYAAAKLGIVGLSKSVALDMGRFNVRSNCISPFAWSRMIGTIPTDTPEQQARVEKIKQMVPARIAPVAVALASDRAKHVTGQIFAVRNNEVFLMSQSRPLRSVQRSDGWTAETVLEHAFPAMQAHFYALDRSADVFSWDPV
ncbi:MAG: SDR family oxidoreductase [Rhodospirillaceae bacterium]|nr:SDR family oxidoreductase [Rhodospirillaceae bacterium]MYB14587.1 SDR family oxidoreductase [Rhodospirillaceae bacterium]MYI47453.1 SDR family oxidoreductase [Rhodospirillaceae bacterium]